MNTGSHFEVKQTLVAGERDIAAPVQERSKATAQKFVSAALDLLHEKTFAELSVAELAAKAGRSVGVFYQRFGSKDDFLSVLLSAYFEDSLVWRRKYVPTGTAEEIYLHILTHGYHHIVSNKNLWHAALERSAADPSFWIAYAPFREEVMALSLHCVEQARGKPLTAEERFRLGLAGQVFNSVINNQIINGPGPLTLEDERFLPEMIKIVLRIGPFDIE